MNVKMIWLDIHMGTQVEPGDKPAPEHSRRVWVPFTASQIVDEIPEDVKDSLHYGLEKALQYFSRVLEMDEA